MDRLSLWICIAVTFNLVIWTLFNLPERINGVGVHGCDGYHYEIKWIHFLMFEKNLLRRFEIIN